MLPVLRNPHSFQNHVEVQAKPPMPIFAFACFHKCPHCFTKLHTDPARMWPSDVTEGADPTVRLPMLDPVPYLLSFPTYAPPPPPLRSRSLLPLLSHALTPSSPLPRVPLPLVLTPLHGSTHPPPLPLVKTPPVFLCLPPRPLPRPLPSSRSSTTDRCRPWSSRLPLPYGMPSLPPLGGQIRHVRV